MDLRQLEILQAIAETGSFTACGKKLNVSQSAISRQILLLEDELGEPLFLRVGRQVRMTPAAESLVQLGQRVFLDVRETVGSITDRTRELRGTLRLSGGMTVCLYVFPPLLKHLRRVHPHLDVRLTVALAGRSVQEIRGGRVDAGLLTLPVEETDLVTVPALREELLLIASPTHQLAKRRKVQPRDLDGLPFVLFEVGSATRKVIDNFFASQNMEPTIVMDTENVEIIKAMVKTGLGVGIVPYQAVAREVKAGQLFCARIEGHELVRETGWVYARANRVPRIVDELLLAFGADPRQAAAGAARPGRRRHRLRRPSICNRDGFYQIILFSMYVAGAYPVSHEQRARSGHLHHSVGSRVAGVHRPPAAAGPVDPRADPGRSGRPASRAAGTDRRLTRQRLAYWARS